jgi:uncharacterized DUF497 family protein
MPSSYTWDDEKRLLTIKKHGIDFIDAITVFDFEHLILDARSDLEPRKIAIGKLNDQTIAVVFTMRGETCRIITARKARKDEREKYQDLYGRRNSPHEGPD